MPSTLHSADPAAALTRRSGPFARSLPWLLLVGGLIGLTAAFVLTVEKFALALDPAYAPTCSINPVLNCGSVMDTPQASAFGFPNSLLGIAGFAVVAAVGAGLLAGAAGALLAPVFLVYPDVGQIPVIKGFVIIVLGGMGSILGAVIAAVILGLVESLGSVYFSVAYRDVFAFLVLIGVLLFRPHGLLGQKARRV